MAGLHRRPAEPATSPREDAVLRRRAVASGQPLAREGVVVLDGEAPFLFRDEYLPDGQLRTALVRLDAVRVFPFPPPDRL
ncbi:hypothetical protein [Kitasatospora kifunensis]|uniref:Uncharacterized protein n=1 Tax=Kitasatospora kifunensis TaxID=58351 RepID=A0A7W7RB12_KITKI|nr:hypothetical protein [Kitasatospora kifunensis]MBB4928639.1 hypothetical protein [Kitasatospora kifunensis]